jgi:hypothetical protein
MKRRRRVLVRILGCYLPVFMTQHALRLFKACFQLFVAFILQPPLLLSSANHLSILFFVGLSPDSQTFPLLYQFASPHAIGQSDQTYQSGRRSLRASI